MEYIWLKFLKEWSTYSPGDVCRIKVGYYEKVFKRLIDDGIAERYIPKKDYSNPLG